MRRSAKFILTISLVAAASLVFAWELRFQGQVRAPMALAVAAARSSIAVDRYLGTPLTASTIARGHCACNSSGGTADFTFEIQGPRDRGTLIEWAQADNGKWGICSLDFKPADNSKAITLVDEAQTHCERE